MNIYQPPEVVIAKGGNTCRVPRHAVCYRMLRLYSWKREIFSASFSNTEHFSIPQEIDSLAWWLEFIKRLVEGLSFPHRKGLAGAHKQTITPKMLMEVLSGCSRAVCLRVPSIGYLEELCVLIFSISKRRKQSFLWSVLRQRPEKTCSLGRCCAHGCLLIVSWGWFFCQKSWRDSGREAEAGSCEYVSLLVWWAVGLS